MKKKEWEIKIETEFWICNYGNGKPLMGRDSQRIPLSYVSTEVGASLQLFSKLAPKGGWSHPGCLRQRLEVLEWTTGMPKRKDRNCFLLSSLLFCLQTVSASGHDCTYAHFQIKAAEAGKNYSVGEKCWSKWLNKYNYECIFIFKLLIKCLERNLEHCFRRLCNQNVP